MIQRLLLFILTCTSFQAWSTDYDSLTKTGTIVHFKIQYEKLFVSDSTLLTPIHQQLTRIFKLEEVIDLNEWPVEWVGRYGKLQKKKKLKPEAIAKVDAFAPRTDMIVSIRMDHSYNNILGGLMGGRRHVLWLDVTVFDRKGTVVWRSHKKASTVGYISFHNDSDEEVDEDPLTHDDFILLYAELITKTFGKF